jgi:hypothetical protein
MVYCVLGHSSLGYISISPSEQTIFITGDRLTEIFEGMFDSFGCSADSGSLTALYEGFVSCWSIAENKSPMRLS